jgi:hypothetical protein
MASHTETAPSSLRGQAMIRSPRSSRSQRTTDFHLSKLRVSADSQLSKLRVSPDCQISKLWVIRSTMPETAASVPVQCLYLYGRIRRSRSQYRQRVHLQTSGSVADQCLCLLNDFRVMRLQAPTRDCAERGHRQQKTKSARLRAFVSGRYWARTSDPQLVEMVQPFASVRSGSLRRHG